MAKGNHNFTEQDIRQRFNSIVGHTVADVDTAALCPTSSTSYRDSPRAGQTPA